MTGSSKTSTQKTTQAIFAQDACDGEVKVDYLGIVGMKNTDSKCLLDAITYFCLAKNSKSDSTDPELYRIDYRIYS